MSDFPYASIPEYQKWTIVSDVEDRADQSVQGPVKFRLSRDAKIASAGSCFAARIAERIPAYGLNYFIAEASAAPYSARFGNVYSARQLQQLLDRALGRFDPLERVWPTPNGYFLDPFRPTVEAPGFRSAVALEEDRVSHLAAVARLFTELDVFVFTLGLTEIWSDARDGAVFPTCPGRGRGDFDAERHVFSNLDVAETCAALDAFLATLAEINPSARVILTVSPVAIAATMEPMHVVRASLLTKSILKVAAETTARRHANVDYFASYDSVMANLGAERLFAADGRHVIDGVADRVVRELAVCYFLDPPEKPDAAPARSAGASNGERIELADDCDEDRLLKLFSRDAARTPSNGSATLAAKIAHPIPLYVAGDSGTLGFRNCVFTIPGYRQSFVGCALHTFALYAGELTDGEGNLNASLMSQLLAANLIDATGDGSYRIMTDYDRMLGHDEERFRYEPPLMLCCGSYDAPNLRMELENRSIELPEGLRPGRYPDPHIDDVPFEDAIGLALNMLAPFERGLEVLRSYGFKNLAVHMIVPPGPEPSFFVPNQWYDIEAAYSAVIVMNAAIAEVCARVGVPHVDIWSQVTGPDGLRDTRYSLDTAHLNYDASILSVEKLLGLLDAQVAPAYAPHV